MADTFIQLPEDGAGKKVRSFSSVEGGETVHSQGSTIVDKNGNVMADLDEGGRLRVNASGVAVPVTDNDGSLTVDSPQLPAALESGRLPAQITVAPLQRIGLTNPQVTGLDALVTPSNELLSVQRCRQFGDAFSAATLDPDLWTSSSSGGGSVTISSARLVLTVGTDSGAAASLLGSRNVRMVAGQVSIVSFIAQVVMGAAGEANKRRLGVWAGTVSTPTDGYWFEFEGDTVYAVTCKSGVLTRTASSAWNIATFTNLGTFNEYAVVYGSTGVGFLVNGSLRHFLHPATLSSPLTDGLLFKVFADNRNPSANAAGRVITIKSVTATSVGVPSKGERSRFLNSAGTHVLKSAPGHLARVVVLKTGSGGATTTIYDNAAGSGTVIAVIDTTVPSGASLEFGVNTSVGLTVVNSASTSPQCTVVYD